MENKTTNASFWIIAVIIIILLAGGAYMYYQKPGVSPISGNTIDGNISVDASGNSSDLSSRTFDITASNFQFSVSEIRVKLGDTVKIVLTNTDGFHDWVIDEFNAKTPRLDVGESATVQFIADKPGTFEYYCSIGNHRQMGMVGKLIVE